MAQWYTRKNESEVAPEMSAQDALRQAPMPWDPATQAMRAAQGPFDTADYAGGAPVSEADFTPSLPRSLKEAALMGAVMAAPVVGQAAWKAKGLLGSKSSALAPGASSAKRAMLVPFSGPNNERGFMWQDSMERDLAAPFASREQALANAPKGYRHVDDSGSLIPELNPQLTRPRDVQMGKVVGDSPTYVHLTSPDEIEPEALKMAFFADVPGVTVTKLREPIREAAAPGAQKFRLDFHENGRTVAAPADLETRFGAPKAIDKPKPAYRRLGEPE
jgi:hypothetical protein